MGGRGGVAGGDNAGNGHGKMALQKKEMLAALTGAWQDARGRVRGAGRLGKAGSLLAARLKVCKKVAKFKK